MSSYWSGPIGDRKAETSTKKLSRACNELEVGQEIISSFYLLFLVEKMTNMLSVYLNKHLRNSPIGPEVDPEGMLYKHRKRFYQAFQFCHFLRDINLSSGLTSLGEDVNVIVWWPGEGFQLYRPGVTAWYIARRRVTICISLMVAHEQQASPLRVLIWLRHAACGMRQASHKAKYKRQTSLTSMKQAVEYIHFLSR